MFIFHEYYSQTARESADNFSLQIASESAVSALKASKAKKFSASRQPIQEMLL